MLRTVFAHRLFPFATLLLAALLVYAPALQGEFLWDDIYLVGLNPYFKSPIFAFEVFRHYLYPDSFSVYYRPVQNLSYMFDYWVWNGNTFGYHLANILFHAVSGCLLFVLLRKILPPLLAVRGEEKPVRVIAFVIALIWTVHPIHNAAVAYVAGRADSLASMFALGAWLLYFAADRFQKPAGRFGIYALAALFCLLALCAKEIAFIWLALFLFHALAFDRQRAWRPRLASVAALLLVVGCYGALRHLAASGASLGADVSSTFAARVVLMLRALGDYTSLIFWPADLHMERVIFSTDPARNVRYESLAIVGLFTLLAVGCGALRRSQGQTLRRFAAGWLLIGFLPISNLFPLNAKVAEHWFYMPSIGLLLFLAGCVVAFPKRLQIAMAACAVLLALPLGIRTSWRSAEWANPEVFYRQTIAAGGSSARVNLNLANILSARGDLPGAECVLLETLQRFPDDIPARLNLGINLLKQGRHENAEPLLKYDATATEHLAKTAPRTWSAALNLAHLRHQEHRPAEALAILQAALAHFPESWELVELQALILAETNDENAALPMLEAYANEHWWHYESFLALGRFQLLAGKIDEGIASLRHAASLDLHAAEPFNTIARAQLATHRFAEAFAAQKTAIRRHAAEPAEYLSLAAILHHLGRPEEARDAERKAAALQKSLLADAAG